MNKIKIKQQLRRQMQQTRALYIAALLIGIVAVVLLIWFGVRALANQLAGEEQDRPFSFLGTQRADECDHRRLLDGVCVESAEETAPRLVAVMIENHPDARPQSGLADASVVYEAPVEANFSRFLVIYPEDADVDKAGPVRSARPYYLDWVREYGDPVYMHVGGSPDALARIYRGGFFDVNEMGRGWYFWRSSDRYAPHNTYTSRPLWTDAIDDYWEEDFETTFSAWRFETEEPCQAECVHTVSVTFSYPSYVVDWAYDSETERYVRYQTGFPHADQYGETIMADTVIVQRVETTVLDNVGRLSMETIGEGEAMVFRGGNMIPARWRKNSETDRTRWLDADGNDIALAPGKIWIEVVNQRGDVEWETDTTEDIE